MQTDSGIQVEKSAAGIVDIRLNRPDRLNALGVDMTNALLAAITEAAAGDARVIVIRGTGRAFCAGADLKERRTMDEAARVKHNRAINAAVDALGAAPMPTLCAINGLALGGGCEFVMHCDRAVATLESYIGLVEVGVGLLPAGGGCKEFALRAAQEAKGGDAFPFLRRYFESVAMAQVGRSAEHAREIGYLRASDRIVMKLVASDWLMQSVQLTQIAKRSIQNRAHVIICGYGRSGQNLAALLEEQGLAYVALDLDPERIRQASVAGHSVVLGDAARLPSLMGSMNRALQVVDRLGVGA